MPAVDARVDVVVDGAVDMSATFVIHGDESTMIIPSRSWGSVSGATDREVDDNGGAHVHGAVDDHVSACVDRILGTP